MLIRQKHGAFVPEVIALGIERFYFDEILLQKAILCVAKPPHSNVTLGALYFDDSFNVQFLQGRVNVSIKSHRVKLNNLLGEHTIV